MKVSHVLLAVLGASIACSAFAAPALDGTLKKAKDTGIFTIGYRDAVRSVLLPRRQGQVDRLRQRNLQEHRRRC